jgi:hypothetical protein
VINAVDYDLGRNGIVYFDNDTADFHVSTGKRGAGNRGNMYRNDGVDIAMDSSSTNDFIVTNIENEEWLQYTVFPSAKGSYTLRFNCLAKGQEGKFSVSVNGNIYHAIVPKSDTWEMVEVLDVDLPKGQTIIRVIVEIGGFDFKSIQFK